MRETSSASKPRDPGRVLAGLGFVAVAAIWAWIDAREVAVALLIIAGLFILEQGPARAAAAVQAFRNLAASARRLLDVSPGRSRTGNAPT